MAAGATEGVSDFQYDLSSFMPFRDKEACARVRAIPRSRITEHPNPDFHIRVIEDKSEFYGAFAAVDMMMTVARFRGLSCAGKVAYAEGFKRLDAWGRNPVVRMLP